MPAKVNDAYRTYNLLVRADSGFIEAGFHEISGLTTEKNRKAVEVTLKRGIIGIADFLDWISKGQVRRRNIKIELRDTSLSKVIKTCILINAQPIRCTPPVFIAKGGSEAAIEELVLSCEKLDLS